MKIELTVILVTSFVANLISTVYTLFIPLLAFQLGANPFEVGAVGGVSYVVYSFMPFVMGRFSTDRRRGRILALLAVVLLAAVSFLYTKSSSPSQFIALRAVEGLGWATYWPIVEASVVQDSTNVGRTFNQFNAVWASAAALGPLFGALLSTLFQSAVSIVVVSTWMLVAVGVVTALPVLGALWRAGPTRREDLAHLRVEGGSGASPRLVPREGPRTRANPIWFYLIPCALVTATRNVEFTFFPPLAQSTGIPILIVGSAAFVLGAVRVVTYLLATQERFRRWLLERKKIRRKVLLSVLGVTAAGMLPVVPESTGVLDFASFALIGLAISILFSISQMEIVAESTPEKRAASAGLLESSLGVGMSAGPILAGAVSGASLVVPFFVPGMMFLVALPLLLAGPRFVDRRRQGPRTSPAGG